MFKSISQSVTKLSLTVLFSCSLLFTSCNLQTPEKIFSIAVLNTNTINDFGTPGLAKHINDETIEFPNTPSSKKKGEEAQTSIQNNILYMEKCLKDIKGLPDAESSKEIKKLSISLYEYVIPVYKNEYLAYAKLCDHKASQDQKDTILKTIDTRYKAGFETKYKELMAQGKAYADKNGVKVNWN